VAKESAQGTKSPALAVCSRNRKTTPS